MLERINLNKASVKNEFKSDIKKLKAELSVLQQTVKEKKLPVIIVFEGWGAAGKGSMISEMISGLDPRSFKVYSATSVDISETRKPWLWRYWDKLPEYGRFAILDRSWYKEISTARVEEKLSGEEIEKRIESINTFERQLTDDGYLIVKFFLHISQKEQKQRFEKLSENKHTAWRVTDRDMKRNKHYDEFYSAFDDMCERTNSDYAPWNIIGCHDKSSAEFEIYRCLVDSINKALNNLPITENKSAEKQFSLLTMPKLSDVDLDKTISDEDYDKKLKEEQKKLNKLQNKLYREKIPVVIAFEGWDAAGKGGAIKRVAAALDPRGYEAVPVAAPDKSELNHHYLWRFWRNLPKTGHIAMFDRSWYGRVMVERIEGFAPEKRWKQAYREINEFEYELSKWGAIVLKFWLQIDKDEQLARFTERQNTPEKQWKITEEDWRNREKWDSYETAVNEMLSLTSTSFAPWHIIEAKDKKFARIKVLKTINKSIEAYLEQR